MLHGKFKAVYLNQRLLCLLNSYFLYLCHMGFFNPPPPLSKPIFYFTSHISSQSSPIFPCGVKNKLADKNDQRKSQTVLL